jgi:hypothetical protein
MGFCPRSQSISRIKDLISSTPVKPGASIPFLRCRGSYIDALYQRDVESSDEDTKDGESTIKSCFNAILVSSFISSSQVPLPI